VAGSIANSSPIPGQFACITSASPIEFLDPAYLASQAVAVRATAQSKLALVGAPYKIVIVDACSTNPIFAREVNVK
jgi:hypothetical protein